MLPGRFGYADPPYPGKAQKYYGNEVDFDGEVNHEELIASLEASGYMGWALSTSAAALRDVLPMCPAGAHVAPWLKPYGVSKNTRGIQYCWEPIIVVRGRQQPPGVRDYLVAQPARGGAGMERSKLMGRKPIAFCAWLFDLLGMQPGDSLDDLFPGSGIVGSAWASLGADAAASLGTRVDASLGARANVSREYSTDGSPSLAAAPDMQPSLKPRGSVSLRYHNDKKEEARHG